MKRDEDRTRAKEKAKELVDKMTVECEVHLAVAEQLTRESVVPGSAFLVVNDEVVFVKGSNSCVLYVGTGQPDERTAALTGKKSVKVPVK